MTKRFKTPKPPEATWRIARLHRANFYNVKWPVCGNRLVWVVGGPQVGEVMYTCQTS